MPVITPMNKDDLNEVCEIEKQCFSIPWSKRSFEEALDNRNACYLTAKLYGKVVGYCGAYKILDEADINQVAVADSYRRKGIGRAVLGALLQHLEEEGITAITLEVRSSNTPAVRLYESMGFSTEGIRKNFYEKPTEDALIMWKR